MTDIAPLDRYAGAQRAAMRPLGWHEARRPEDGAGVQRVQLARKRLSVNPGRTDHAERHGRAAADTDLGPFHQPHVRIQRQGLSVPQVGRYWHPAEPGVAIPHRPSILRHRHHDQVSADT